MKHQDFDRLTELAVELDGHAVALEAHAAELGTGNPKEATALRAQAARCANTAAKLRQTQQADPVADYRSPAEREFDLKHGISDEQAAALAARYPHLRRVNE